MKADIDAIARELAHLIWERAWAMYLPPTHCASIRLATELAAKWVLQQHLKPDLSAHLPKETP